MDEFTDLLLADQTKAPVVIELCRAIREHWQLPEEDAVIERRWCDALVVVKKVAGVVVNLDDMGAASADCDVDVYDGSIDMDSKRHSGKRSAQTSKRQLPQTLDCTLELNSTCRAITETDVTKLLKLVDMAAQIEVELVGTEIARTYEGHEVTHVTGTAERLIGTAGDPPQDRQRLAVLATCLCVCCRSESFRVTPAELAIARASFAAGVKLSAPEHAMDAVIGTPREGHGVKLAQCVLELKGNGLPEQVGVKLDSCVQMLLDAGLLLDKVLYGKWVVILKGVSAVRKTSPLSCK
ncbi:unnamed protein product [Prorocentrum cordatum]|uniref:Uncharacterized protein n=1 Tax=Prorocentrum cordatum TaxID=2364126 RepID=A0ABN9VUL3_9DINO|nr:unnamed protein product [Polarella glacialis]